MSMVTVKLDAADIQVAAAQYLRTGYGVTVDPAGLKIEMRPPGKLEWERAVIRVQVEIPGSRVKP